MGHRQRHVEVKVAWRCAQHVRSAYHQLNHTAGGAIAETILASLATRSIPKVARLSKTLQRWRSKFLGYFDTDGANNGSTEAVNNLIELARRGPRVPEPRQLPALHAAGRRRPGPRPSTQP